MLWFRVGIYFLAIFFVILGQAKERERWCFHFTWLGPKTENNSFEENTTTCETLQQPCVEPLVITNNRNPPNTSLMWKMYGKEKFVKQLVLEKYACLKWTNYYASEVENITYMFGSMTGEDGKAVTSGCEVQEKGARKVEVCACNNFPGEPCNSSPWLRSPSLMFALFPAMALAASVKFSCLLLDGAGATVNAV